MKQWYFDYNGKRYQTGQVILIKGYDSLTHEPIAKEAVFVWYEPNSGRYEYKKIGNMYGSVVEPARTFEDQLIGVVEGRLEMQYVDREFNEWYQRNKKLTFAEELEVKGMLGAWTTYIFAMLLSLVCMQWFFGWIISSLVFFTYRHNKLEERKDK